MPEPDRAIALERPTLSTFTAEAAALDGPDWLRLRRTAAAERFASMGLPSSEEEVWRYSRIDELDLDRFRPVTEPPPPERRRTTDFGPTAAEITVSNGWSGEPTSTAAGVEVRNLATDTVEEPDREDAPSDDPFVALNQALAPGPLEVVIGRGRTVADPIVIRHRIQGDDVLVAPQLTITAEEGSEAVLIEVFESTGGSTALSLPVTRIDIGRAARLTYLSAQDLDPATWQIANQISRVEQEATFVGATAALGGDYARLRTDCRLVGRGATGDLLAAYFGDGSQHLDFRTFQDHRAPDTTSNLLFKGTVGGHSRSVYTGLIRVRKNARGTNAIQTNRNIKLSDHAWAESVPNLEIENNDVRCSHASAVGPIDDEQRFYLESRGVPPQVAERLIVAGFFAEVLARMSVAPFRERVRLGIAAKLDRSEDVA